MKTQSGKKTSLGEKKRTCLKRTKSGGGGGWGFLENLKGERGTGKSGRRLGKHFKMKKRNVFDKSGGVGRGRSLKKEQKRGKASIGLKEKEREYYGQQMGRQKKGDKKKEGTDLWQKKDATWKGIDHQGGKKRIRPERGRGKSKGTE